MRVCTYVYVYVQSCSIVEPSWLPRVWLCTCPRRVFSINKPIIIPSLPESEGHAAKVCGCNNQNISFMPAITSTSSCDSSPTASFGVSSFCTAGFFVSSVYRPTARPRHFHRDASATTQEQQSGVITLPPQFASRSWRAYVQAP